MKAENTRLSINTQTTVHVNNTTPRINVYNIENREYIKDHSFMSVAYEMEYSSEGRISIHLDYASAKALAESIIAKLNEFKYRD